MEYPNAIRPPDYNSDVDHTDLYSVPDQTSKNETDIPVTIVETDKPPDAGGGNKADTRESEPQRIGNKCATRNHSLSKQYLIFHNYY